MLDQILWTASVTPFDKNSEQVDYRSLESCLKRQAASGNGVVLLGSTGEGLSLRQEEKRAIVNFACSLKVRPSLIVGISGHDIDAAIDLLDFCKDLPVQGHLLTTPIYTKPGILGQTAWFEQLLERSTHPAMLYNIPGRAAVRLYAETVNNLQQHEKFVAIKDSAGSVESLVSYKMVAPDVAVFCGDDYMMPAMAAEGAEGLVSIASNVWPSSTRRYVSHSLEGGKISSKIWWQATRALLSASNPIPVKSLMKEKNMIACDSVRLPLCVSDLPSLQPLLEYHNIIQSWQP